MSVSFDGSDDNWQSAHIRNIFGVWLRIERRLTPPEWVKVRLFRRPDPRVVWLDAEQPDGGS